MKLLELGRPQFLKMTNDTTWHHVDFAEADGIMFLCPVCFQANNGPVGTHSIICWQPHVPQTVSPTPGRWKFNGTGLGDLTLVGHPTSSVMLSGPGCGAHFSIVNGEIIPA